jgi:hypothetical protein
MIDWLEPTAPATSRTPLAVTVTALTTAVLVAGLR